MYIICSIFNKYEDIELGMIYKSETVMEPPSISENYLCGNNNPQLTEQENALNLHPDDFNMPEIKASRIANAADGESDNLYKINFEETDESHEKVGVYAPANDFYKHDTCKNQKFFRIPEQQGVVFLTEEEYKKLKRKREAKKQKERAERLKKTTEVLAKTGVGKRRQPSNKRSNLSRTR